MDAELFLGLSAHAWITAVTVFSIFFVMARTRIPAEVAFLGALTILLVTGVVTEEEGMAGFGSEPVVVHAAFFVIIAGLMQSGVLYWLTKHVLGDPKNYHRAIIKLMVPISILGALLNSVNVVALFIDAVKIWFVEWFNPIQIHSHYNSFFPHLFQGHLRPSSRSGT